MKDILETALITGLAGYPNLDVQMLGGKKLSHQFTASPVRNTAPSAISHLAIIPLRLLPYNLFKPYQATALQNVPATTLRTRRMAKLVAMSGYEFYRVISGLILRGN